MYKIYEQLRNERGLTDYKVAHAAGIPDSTLYDWKQRSKKNSSASMSLGAIVKIAAVLEVPIDTLVKDKEVTA